MKMEFSILKNMMYGLKNIFPLILDVMMIPHRMKVMNVMILLLIHIRYVLESLMNG